MAALRTGLRILAVAATVAVGGCSTLGLGGNSSSSDAAPASGNSGAQFWRNTFMFGASQPPKIVAPDKQTREMTCPPVTILDGTAAYRVGGASNEAVQYQASLTQFARECKVENNTLYMRVGVEGRLLLGPAGKPGTYPIPVRVAVKDGDKAAYSTATRVSVTIPPGQDQVSFTHVQDGIVLPIDDRDPGDRYEILVGFDPTGAQAVHHKQKRKHRR